MVNKLLLVAAATVAFAAPVQSRFAGDDPARALSAVGSIHDQLRRGGRGRGLRRRAESLAGRRDLAGGRDGEASPLISPVAGAVTSDAADAVVAADTKIIGGIPSAPGRYPYLASLLYFGTHICGGSMVAKDVVLSAAHCAGYSSHIELGRHDKNQQFDEALHEQIEVAYEIKHPGWNPETVDNDFMLMKLVRPSAQHPIVKLNTDPDFPSIPGEKLTLMGWGDTDKDPDVNTPSTQLLEIELEYVPDDQCRAKDGTVGPDTVSYSQRITDNMMCAMDQDGGRGDSPVDEDTCLGDSGGPMVIPLAGVDLQVGVVSWGIGCASPTFPGVYSRISSQFEWIRKTTCEHSAYATEGFECDGLGGVGGGAGAGFPMDDDGDDALDSSRTHMTLEVSLDEQPQEFSWMVSTLEGSNSQLVAAIPPGFYSGYTSYTFHHKLEVDDNRFYRISLRDTFGDGLEGYVAVYRGTVPILSNLVMYERLFYDKDRTDFKRVDHAFFTGTIPPNYFSLAITFDKFPKDLWWKLESETDSVILEQRPPGWYNERFELMSIVETMVVFGERAEDVSYRFTIGDSYPCDDDPTKVCGDGICCNYGRGEYRLFRGHPSGGQLLSSGGNYGLSHSLIIDVV